MSARLARVNPLTLFGALLLIDVPLLVSLDVPSAVAALAAECVLLPLAAIPARGLARRAVPLVLAGIATGVTLALYGRSSGAVLFTAFAAVVSTGSLVLAAATALRLVALALPAAVLLAGLDPMRLGEALAQRLHVPARFVLPAVAATRLAGVLGDDRRTIALARRARGLRGGPVAGVSALLVTAVRRGTDLATAMEARGLGAPGPRTWSRRSRFGREDVIVLTCALLVVAAAVAAGVTAGTYRAVLVP